MTKNLKWRLKELPTGDEIAQLVEQGVITKEEARELLFSDSKANTEELMDRIKFLEDLVEKLTDKIGTEKFTTIYYPRKYEHYPWWGSGGYYLSTGGASLASGNVTYTATSSNNVSVK